MYLIQGTDSSTQLTAPLEQFEAMYNDGISDYFVDHGLYYPNAIGYGYVCTGFEPTGGSEDHAHIIMGPDGRDIQYTGAANEYLPYGYYTTSYGYGQSPYNPYNPYIPGAMIGMDGSFVTAQQCYSLPSFENCVSSPYVPVVLQSGPDAVGMADSSMDAVASVERLDGLGTKRQLCSNTYNSLVATVGDASCQKNSFATLYEGGRSNTGLGKQSVPGTTSGRFTSQSSLQVPQVRGAQGSENVLHGMASSCNSQLKSAFPTANGPCGLESSNHASIKVKPKLHYGSKCKNQLIVKAYTTRCGNPDPQGNITIFTDQYNKEDFPVDYVNAKFFVIKSYSEDDVHKSIKYNVWSSTPNGNKKLNAAYEDALRICAGDSRGCPIFLFFSVNASGQFCGVAEMTDSVDFDRDMDFWQQDKWSASFPVKWHIIKDLPNLNLRHIILENNENKPVTNSRDTQEICYKKGLEMLQIFKSYTSKTSLLDDFMYYENRQRIIQEERSRYLVPLVDPPRKLHSVHDFPCIGANSKLEGNNLAALNKSKVSADSVPICQADTRSATMGQASLLHTDGNKLSGVARSPQLPVDEAPNAVDELKISSWSMHSDEAECVPSLPEGTLSNSSRCELIKVVTIGSMPVKVADTESSGSILTVGTIPLDPRALKHE